MIYNYLNNRIHIDGDGKVPNGILVLLFDSTKLAHRMRNIFIFPNIPEKRCLFAQFPLKSVKNGKIWKCFGSSFRIYSKIGIPILLLMMIHPNAVKYNKF